MIFHDLYYLFFLPSTLSSSKSFLASSSFCKSSPQLPPTHPLQPLRSASTSREQSEQVEGEEEELMVEELDTVRMRRWHITGRPAECSKFKNIFPIILCVGNRSFLTAAHGHPRPSSAAVGAVGRRGRLVVTLFQTGVAARIWLLGNLKNTYLLTLIIDRFFIFSPCVSPLIQLIW